MVRLVWGPCDDEMCWEGEGERRSEEDKAERQRDSTGKAFCEPMKMTHVQVDCELD